jgi:hypothetical protein
MASRLRIADKARNDVARLDQMWRERRPYEAICAGDYNVHASQFRAGGGSEALEVTSLVGPRPIVLPDGEAVAALSAARRRECRSPIRNYWAICGCRAMRRSEKISDSSRLRVENSETTAPSGPAWNQCGVSGRMVCCSPGRSRTSCQTW